MLRHLVNALVHIVNVFKYFYMIHDGLFEKTAVQKSGEPLMAQNKLSKIPDYASLIQCELALRVKHSKMLAVYKNTEALHWRSN